jgi:hypothetical protein
MKKDILWLYFTDIPLLIEFQRFFFFFAVPRCVFVAKLRRLSRGTNHELGRLSNLEIGLRKKAGRINRINRSKQAARLIESPFPLCAANALPPVCSRIQVAYRRGLGTRISSCLVCVCAMNDEAAYLPPPELPTITMQMIRKHVGEIIYMRGVLLFFSCTVSMPLFFPVYFVLFEICPFFLFLQKAGLLTVRS